MNADKRHAIRQRLSEIEAANGGRLTPDAVIQDARNEDSPLHDQFEWDVDKAAYRHWVERARDLITSVRVVQRVEKQTVSTVFYVRDPAASHDEQGYVSLNTLRSDADLAREAIHAEFLRARAVLQRARTLAAVLELSSEVEELAERVDAVIERVNVPQAAAA